MVGDSPASRAGLQPGDLLLRLGDAPIHVRYDEEMPDFMRLVTGLPIGQPVTALVLRGARERIAPILMTALATGLALVPLVMRGNIPGLEIEHPMAMVILGGLFTSTLLNLIVVPSLYLRFGKCKEVISCVRS